MEKISFFRLDDERWMISWDAWFYLDFIVDSKSSLKFFVFFNNIVNYDIRYFFEKNSKSTILTDYFSPERWENLWKKFDSTKKWLIRETWFKILIYSSSSLVCIISMYLFFPSFHQIQVFRSTQKLIQLVYSDMIDNTGGVNVEIQWEMKMVENNNNQH